MNPEIKARWTDALRSGEYPQTANCLRDNKGYCCLGVLTDLAIKDGVIEGWEQASPGGEFYVKENLDSPEEYGEPAILIDAVMAWAGLDSKNPLVRFEGGFANLSDVNDSGHNFYEIAIVIDDQL